MSSSQDQRHMSVKDLALKLEREMCKSHANPDSNGNVEPTPITYQWLSPSTKNCTIWRYRNIQILRKRWSEASSTKKSIRHVLRPDSKEYIKIRDQFHESNVRKNLNFIITKIERILNEGLYRQYQTRKAEMISRSTPPDVMERRLFHVADSETIDRICQLGFNRSYSGGNAALYGEGTYFSNLSSLSDFYTRKYSGTRQMIVADVLTGDYCKGAQSMNDAPVNSRTGQLYDCVVDNTMNPSVFVVFADWAAYPSYVITYVCGEYQ